MTEVAAEQNTPARSKSIQRGIVITVCVLCLVGLYFVFDQFGGTVASYWNAQKTHNAAREKYHAMESFKASGTLVYRRHSGVVPVVEEGTFTVAFRAPNRFYSHQIFNEGALGEHHTLGWGEPEQAFLFRSREGSISRGMEPKYVSNELLGAVTGLLLEPVARRDTLWKGRWRAEGNEEVNGVSCTRLEFYPESFSNGGRPMEAFWIGDDHLVYKHRRYLPRVSDSAYMEFTYDDIQVDVPVSEEELTPDLERFGVQRPVEDRPRFYSFGP